MTLNFFNPSRSYNPIKRSVSFWGYESRFEIAFHVGEDALKMMSAHVQCDEVSFLHVFDVNRVQIESVADNAYSRRRQSYHRLAASDL